VLALNITHNGHMPSNRGSHDNVRISIFRDSLGLLRKYKPTAIKRVQGKEILTYMHMDGDLYNDAAPLVTHFSESPHIER
jgi:hypothetical protein